MELIGVLCTIGYVISSALILRDERVQILFPEGKLGFIAVSVILTLTVMYFLKEIHLTLAVVESIVLASLLIVIDINLIDPGWRKTSVDLANLERSLAQGNYINQSNLNALHDLNTLQRLYWTVVRLIICNVSILVGMLVVMEQEVTTSCKRLFQFVKARMMSMDDHRN